MDGYNYNIYIGIRIVVTYFSKNNIVKYTNCGKVDEKKNNHKYIVLYYNTFYTKLFILKVFEQRQSTPCDCLI